MPLYRVKVSKVSTATIYVAADDEEYATQMVHSEPPEDSEFEEEQFDVLEAVPVDSIDAIGATRSACVRGDSEGRSVLDYFGDEEE